MSKVDPTEFTKLDRRSTILLQVAQKQTEAVEDKGLSGIEDPGIDALRGSFGTVGSIIRARSARRISQSSRLSAHSSRFGAPGPRYDIERGDSKTSSSSAVPKFNHYGGMKRHQLFDPPVPPLPSLDASDTISLSSQPSARKTAIKFGEQDLIHSYRRGTAGKDDMAIHERRDVPLPASPLSLPGSSVLPNLSPPEDSPVNRLRRQQSPPDAEASGLRSAPPGVGPAVDTYRDPFEGAPATAALASSTSLTDDIVRGHRHHRSFSRPGSSRGYPKGDVADDAEEMVSLWDPRETTSDMDVAPLPDSPYGTVRLVSSSRPDRF